MSDDVFYASLDIVKTLIKRGTQRELNLNGNGESTLDPDLPQRVRAVKDLMKDEILQFCTNGVGVTRELLIKLKDAGVDRIDVSPHSAFHARRVVEYLRQLGIPGVVNFGAILDSHNWAGQLPDDAALDEVRIELPCHPLIEGRGYIQSEGNITPCCYDFRNLGVFGTVWDIDLLEREIKPFELCETCHQTIPEGMFN